MPDNITIDIKRNETIVAEASIDNSINMPIFIMVFKQLF